MDKRSREFQIRDLLEITKKNKYATTVAAFEIINNLEKLDLDLKKLGWKTNKPAVIAMMALAKKIINYDYITEEQRKQLEEELKKQSNIHLKRAEEIFQKKKNIVDSEEDLEDEDIGEIATEKMEEYEIEDSMEEDSDNSDDSDEFDDYDDSDDENDSDEEY